METPWVVVLFTRRGSDEGGISVRQPNEWHPFVAGRTSGGGAWAECRARCVGVVPDEMFLVDPRCGAVRGYFSPGLG
jgi:hypothetical protein